jgi:transaldolase
VLANFVEAGIDADLLAAQLQDEGVQGFVKSWKGLLECITAKCKTLKRSANSA